MSARIGAAVAVCMVAAACSSSGSPAGSVAGVPSSTALGSLTAQQQASLCDWVAQQYGGYGHSAPCGDAGSKDGPSTQAECVGSLGSLSGCPATVGQVSSCLQQSGVCGADGSTSPDCAAVNACSSNRSDGSGCAVNAGAEGSGGSCSASTSWDKCANGNTYEVDCACPDSRCICKKNGSPTGVTVPFSCPSGCLGSAPGFQACGFP
jgi:hypothetical protein